MKETEFSNETDQNEEDMLPEYDFSAGVRGKHAKAYRNGYRVIIYKIDGSTEIQEMQLPPEAIFLDPDVRRYFRDAETVNETLRSLIALLPKEEALDRMPA